MIKNHYGVTVDSEIPTTGVISVNSLNFEMFDYDDQFCLTCERILEEIDEEFEDEEERQEAYDHTECDPSHETLYGSWKKGNDGIYDIDKSGEYAAMGSESEIQIVWSKFTKRGALCSPCFPGQVDLDSEGEFLGFTFPDYMIRKEE